MSSLVNPDENGFPDFKTKIECMHQLFYGGQDSAIKKHLEKKEKNLISVDFQSAQYKSTPEYIEYNMEIDKSREPIICEKDIEIEPSRTSWLNNNTFDMWPHGNHRYGLSTIKILNKEILDENDLFQMEIGNQRIDEIQFFGNEKPDELTFGMTSNGNFIPGLIWHDIKMIYKNIGEYNGMKPVAGIKKIFKLQYTLIPLMPGPIAYEGIMIQHYPNYYDQETKLHNGKYIHRINMNHPAFVIDLYTQNEVSEVIKLNIHGGQFTLDLTKLSPKHWQLKFGDDYDHTLNFSRIDNCIFECNEDMGRIRYNAKLCQIYRIYSEMFGLAFSK